MQAALLADPTSSSASSATAVAPTAPLDPAPLFTAVDGRPAPDAGAPARTEKWDSAALLWKMRANTSKRGASKRAAAATAGASVDSNGSADIDEMSAMQERNSDGSIAAPTKTSSALKTARRGPGRPKKSDGNAKHAAKWDDEVTALFLKLRFQDMRPSFESVRNNVEVGECWVQLARTLSDLSGKHFDSHQCQSKLRNLKKSWREMSTSSKVSASASSLYHLLSQYLVDNTPNESSLTVAHRGGVSESGDARRNSTGSADALSNEEQNASDANNVNDGDEDEEEGDEMDVSSENYGAAGEDVSSADIIEVRAATQKQTSAPSNPDAASVSSETPVKSRARSESAPSTPASRKRQKRSSTSATTAPRAAARISDGGIDSSLLSVASGLRTMMEGVIASKEESTEQQAILTELREHNALMKQYCAEVSKQTASLNALIDIISAKFRT